MEEKYTLHVMLDYINLLLLYIILLAHVLSQQ